MIVEKRIAGRWAADYIEDGMVVGLGTGSTVQYTLERLAEMIAEGNIDIVGIPSSKATEKVAENLGIPLSSLDEHTHIDITIDGADEVDPELNLIKGGGGALLREKMIAYHSEQVIIVVDQSKMVDLLGLKFCLPIEVVPFWNSSIINNVEDIGCSANLRMENNSLFKTDNMNYIVDCMFHGIKYPDELSLEINAIPGVVENGLFIDLASMVIVGKKDGVEEYSID